MREKKIEIQSDLKIQKKAIKELYHQMYSRAERQLEYLSREEVALDKAVVARMLDRYVRQRMQSYGFAIR